MGRYSNINPILEPPESTSMAPCVCSVRAMAFSAGVRLGRLLMFIAGFSWMREPWGSGVATLAGFVPSDFWAG